MEKEVREGEKGEEEETKFKQENSNYSTQEAEAERHEDLCESKASLVSMVSSKPARATQRNPVSNKHTSQNPTNQAKIKTKNPDMKE